MRAACRSSSRCSALVAAVVAAAPRPTSRSGTRPTDDPRLRALRGVGHRAHRLGRSALARPDGVRRPRRADRGRVRPRRHGSTSAGTARASSTARIAGDRRSSWAILLGACVACLVAVVGRRRRAARARAAARDQHAGVRDRGAGVHLRRPIFTAGSTDGRAPAHRHRPARPHAPQPRLLLLRARRARDRARCSSGTCAAPASAA